MTTNKLLTKAMDFIAEVADSPHSQERQDILDVIFDALLFIGSSGQTYVFEDYRKHLASDDPPRVIASFSTREEAEIWLRTSQTLPSSAYVLVADQYHQLMYVRESNHRRIFAHPVLEYYLGARLREGLPPPVASFATMEEAKAWFQDQNNPPLKVVIQISGEAYLAVYHSNINHRSIYPLSMAIAVEPPEGHR